MISVFSHQPVGAAPDREGTPSFNIMTAACKTVGSDRVISKAKLRFRSFNFSLQVGVVFRAGLSRDVLIVKSHLEELA